MALLPKTILLHEAIEAEMQAKASTSDVPTALSELTADSTHRLVTDAEKSTWNGKQNALTPQTNILDADGTLADLTTKFNTLLGYLRTLNILEGP